MTDKQKKTETPKEKPVSDKQASAKKTPANKKTSSAPTTNKKSGGGIAWLAFILVIACAAAGYVGFTQLEQQITDLAKQSDSVKESASDLSTELQLKTNALNTHIANLNKRLETLQNQSNEKIDLLQKQVGKNRRQWLIAEAEYLTSLANNRLQLVGDVDTAIVALQAADQRLKENGDPMTFSVRKQLAKEINILRGIELPDVVGISSQLLALEGAISKMNITEPHAGTAQTPEIGSAGPSAIPDNIQDTLNEAWENFSKLIVVRRLNKPMAALMTPEQVELIRKNLALKLEAARLALIDQNEALYKASISISMDWLQDYFDASQPSVSSALEQLETLKNTAVKTTLPSISLSLKMLRDLPLLAIPEQATAIHTNDNDLPTDSTPVKTAE
ncbi:MAG: hypothetical protein COB22_03345 [Cycloclasticus sp.]|nr:MAG: hypothetical protein COB22_03345 [Cycloclasticus sp.]